MTVLIKRRNEEPNYYRAGVELPAGVLTPLPVSPGLFFFFRLFGSTAGLTLKFAGRVSGVPHVRHVLSGKTVGSQKTVETVNKSIFGLDGDTYLISKHCRHIPNQPHSYGRNKRRGNPLRRSVA
jgi:hypothetical protein